jgi:oligoendopeptidase F
MVKNRTLKPEVMMSMSSSLAQTPATSPAATSETHYAGPAWNNSTEYPSLTSNEFTHDRKDVEALVEKITTSIANIKPLMTQTLSAEGTSTLGPTELDTLIVNLQAISELNEQASTLFHNLRTYVSCERCVDAKADLARQIDSELTQLATNFASATRPFWLFLERAPENVIALYLVHPHTRPEEFFIRQARLQNDLLLTEQEETLLTRMNQFGPTAWGELYNEISGKLVCRVIQPNGQSQDMGLSQASGLLRDADESVRRSAWIAIQEAWRTHETSCAAVLNGLAGWRLEEVKRRSHTRTHDFLEKPLQISRIRRETLDAMLEAVQSQVEVGRRALRSLASALGKDQADPWDLLASAPQVSGRDSRRTYKEGLGLIHSALNGVDATLGDFVATMEKNNWIEGRVLPNKRQGAFCTRFAKSRTPRVFQTYMGSVSDIRTLAHELGHAYHAWVMRDLPSILHRYPMTLAETASIFAETALCDQLSAMGGDEERFEVSWQNAEAAAAFLLNLPARFTFEKNFYEKRARRALSAGELSDLTEAAWDEWYGDTISMPERQFWMTKLHFSMAGLSFYNFPYTFGYLFSLGIYARKDSMGADFMPTYVSLLRDTGRMTAEDLAMKYLGEDITKPEFWQKSIEIVSGQVTEFENLLAQRTASARLHQ